MKLNITPGSEGTMVSHGVDLKKVDFLKNIPKKNLLMMSTGGVC